MEGWKTDFGCRLDREERLIVIFVLLDSVMCALVVDAEFGLLHFEGNGTFKYSFLSGIRHHGHDLAEE